MTPGRNTKLQFFRFAVDYIPGNHIEKRGISRGGNWKVGNYRFGYARSPKAIEAVRKNTKAACLEKSRKDKESEE